MTYQPTSSFHIVRMQENGEVTDIAPIAQSNLLDQYGYFIFRQEIFDYINYGEELVVEPFQRLIRDQRFKYLSAQGFWVYHDTFKDKMLLMTCSTAGIPMGSVRILVTEPLSKTFCNPHSFKTVSSRV